jgi:hypothetical protein
MLAKQDTIMKARRTVLGREPARYKTRVIRIRSMLVLLSADEIVNPPIRSMMVGENMMENTYLVANENEVTILECGLAHLVASGVDSRSSPSWDRITRRQTSNRGTNMDVTNRGMAYKMFSVKSARNT